MKHRNSHFAVGYWSRIRNGRATPDQSDIDPKALKRLLPFVFLLDARGGSFIYRLAGTTLCERYGSELRGRDYFLHWDPESSARLSELLRQSLRARLPLCLTSIGAVDHCHMIEIETVLMPITFGAEHPERFLGVAQVLTDVTPLAGQAIRFERLVTSKLVRDEDTGTINPPSAPPPPPSDHDGWRAHPRAPHLRLVSSRVSMDANNDPLDIDAGEIVNNLMGFAAKLKSGRADVGPF
jgi:hypothetical protein